MARTNTNRRAAAEEPIDQDLSLLIEGYEKRMKKRIASRKATEPDLKQSLTEFASSLKLKMQVEQTSTLESASLSPFIKNYQDYLTQVAAFLNHFQETGQVDNIDLELKDACENVNGIVDDKFKKVDHRVNGAFEESQEMVSIRNSLIDFLNSVF